MKSSLLYSGALFAALGWAAPSSNAVQYGGVNIAGFDFGCGTDGTCTTDKAVPPLASKGNADGIGQMQHFSKDDNLNIFRLPVGWQWLVNNNVNGDLDGDKAGQYDELVQGCLQTGAKCIIDIHNYARWNGAIVGQGGPTDQNLADLWGRLAAKYKDQNNVVFGIMNEPHDLDINTWANTVQTVVSQIRGNATMQQMILLPGTMYTSAGAFDSDGSLAALSNVKNPDGSTDNLVFDVHQYLDSDNSGTHTECVQDHSSDYANLAGKLRDAKRQALLSETGGGNTDSCKQYLCSEIATLNSNSDVFLGYVGWAAGSFGSTYELNEVPTNNGGSWTDTPIVDACIKRSK